MHGFAEVGVAGPTDAVEGAEEAAGEGDRPLGELDLAGEGGRVGEVIWLMGQAVGERPGGVAALALEADDALVAVLADDRGGGGADVDGGAGPGVEAVGDVDAVVWTGDGLLEVGPRGDHGGAVAVGADVEASPGFPSDRHGGAGQEGQKERVDPPDHDRDDDRGNWDKLILKSIFNRESIQTRVLRQLWSFGTCL